MENPSVWSPSMSGRGMKKRVIVAIVSAVVLVTAPASASPAAAENFLSGYVSNEDSPSLTKFNTTTNEFDETLEDQLGEPGPIAVTADGTKAYVGESCNLIEPNDGTLTEVPTSQPGFFKIKITNEGCVSQIAISTKADVGDTGETVWAVIGDGVYPVDSNDESVGTPIFPPEECRSGCPGEQVLQTVNDIALSPNGETLYMLYTNETIREENGEVIENFADKLLAFEVGGSAPVQIGEPQLIELAEGMSIAVTPNGNKALITSSSCALLTFCANSLAVFTLEPAPVFEEQQLIELTEAGEIGISPNEKLAFVAQHPGTIFKGETMEGFELETGPPYEDFYFREFDLNEPKAIAFTPDGHTIYVGFHDRSSIEAIAIEPEGGETEIPVGEGPVGGIAIAAAQAPQAKLEVHAAKEGEPTQFDASESTIECDSVQCSEIAEYKWSFGDGSIETTTVPTTQHTYEVAGPFTATVTEVSTYGVSTERLYDGHGTLKNGGPQARATATVTLPTLATQASAPTRLGGTISDTAILSGGEGLGGSVEFQLFGPGAASCEGAPLETFTVPVSGDGEYSSGDFPASEVGTYNWTANYTDLSADPPSLGRCGDAEESVEVGKELPTISGAASSGVVIGGTISDQATVTGGIAPTGTVTFSLYAPADLSCTGAPVYTDTGTLGEIPGEPQVAKSGAYKPTQVGRYRWVASYSGDAFNEAVPGACNAPAQKVSVAKVTPVLATHASPGVRLGEGGISDVATVSGGFETSGTVAFQLFGPADPSCEHTPVFTTSAALGVDGTATSPEYVPAAIGDYHWKATYGGDADNIRVEGHCGEANESVIVAKATAGFETEATARTTIGAAISDTAILSGAHDPSGTITFSLFGPGDENCTGTPIATNMVTVSGNGSFAAQPFTPTVPGTYRWVATYSGDAENEPQTGICGDAGETSIVDKATPTLSTSATDAVDLGGPIAATASVGGGHEPTGTVTFQLFAPGDADCTGSPVFTAVVPLGADGSAASGAFTPIAAGSYAWRTTYSGDADNDSVAGGCGPSSDVTAPAPPSSGPPSSPSSPPPSSPSPKADLSVKLSAPKRGLSGKDLTYRIAVANDGEVAAGSVDLNVRLTGARAEIEKTKGPACKGDRALTCKLGSLAPGTKVEVEITVLPKAAGRLTLTGTVDSAGSDAKPGDNRAADTTRITPRHR
jgi:PKD domain/Domain of unknown function DUF11